MDKAIEEQFEAFKRGKTAQHERREALLVLLSDKLVARLKQLYAETDDDTQRLYHHSFGFWLVYAPRDKEYLIFESDAELIELRGVAIRVGGLDGATSAMDKAMKRAGYPSSEVDYQFKQFDSY